MNILKAIILALFGLGAGTLTSAGYFAIITSVGIINRMAVVTHTENKMKWYEQVIIAGASLGNIVFIFSIKVPIGIVGTIAYGLLSGIYLGLFSVCLAETIKALPIFVRRIRIGTGIGIIIIALALGKAVGHLLYYFKLY